MTSEMGKDVNEVATAVSDIRPVDLLGSTGLLENAIRSALAAVVVIDGSGKIRGWSGTDRSLASIFGVIDPASETDD
jgi:hypothetical protein